MVVDQTSGRGFCRNDTTAGAARAIAFVVGVWRVETSIGGGLDDGANAGSRLTVARRVDADGDKEAKGHPNAHASPGFRDHPSGTTTPIDKTTSRKS